MFTTLVVVAAFAPMFSFAGPPGQVEGTACTPAGIADGVGYWACTRSESYISTLNMMLSGDYPFLGDYPHTQQEVLSMCFAFVIGVILLNVIIAVISDAFAEITDNSDKAFWADRYKFLADVDSLQNLFRIPTPSTLRCNCSSSVRWIAEKLFFGPIDVSHGEEDNNKNKQYEELRTRMDEMKAEMKAEMKEMKDEMKAEMKDEMKEPKKKLKMWKNIG